MVEHCITADPGMQDFHNLIRYYGTEMGSRPYTGEDLKDLFTQLWTDPSGRPFEGCLTCQFLLPV
jgi:hypothetical protein